MTTPEVQIILTSEDIDAIFGFLRRVVTGDIPVSPRTRLDAILYVLEHAHIEPMLSAAELRDAVMGGTGP